MDKSQKFKSLFSTSMIFAFSTVLSKVILSLLLPLYTRMLTAAEYGVAELLTTISQLVVPVCSLAIQDAVFRFSMESGRKPENVLRCSMKVGVIASFVLLLCSIGLIWYEPLSEWVHYFMLISVFTMFRAIFSMYANATHRTMIYAVDNVLYNFILAIANVVFLTLFKWKLNGYFMAMAAANVISIVFLTIRCGLVKELKHSEKDKALLLLMLTYSAPLILNSISWGLTHVVDRVMLSRYADDAATGIYSAASKIPALLSMVVTVFSNAWTLSVVRDYETEKDSAFYKSVFNDLHLCAVLCSIAILLINNQVFPFILGSAFSEAARYVPVLLMGTVFLAYTNYYSSIFAAMKMSKLTMYSSLLGCVVNIVLNAVLIPRIGIMGACLATTSSYIFIAVFRVIFCQKYDPIDISYPKWILSLLILLALAAAVTYHFHGEILSLATGIIICLLYFKELKELIHTVAGVLRRRGTHS